LEFWYFCCRERPAFYVFFCRFLFFFLAWSLGVVPRVLKAPLPLYPRPMAPGNATFPSLGPLIPLPYYPFERTFCIPQRTFGAFAPFSFLYLLFLLVFIDFFYQQELFFFPCLMSFGNLSLSFFPCPFPVFLLFVGGFWRAG